MILRKHYLLIFFILASLFAPSIRATTYSQLQYSEFMVSGNAQSSPSQVSMIGKNNNIGINILNPTSKLSVSYFNNEYFSGSARSKAFITSSGSLGNAAGSEIALSSIGFTSSNQIALGIRGIRRVTHTPGDGLDWTTSGLELGMDVDATPHANSSPIYLDSNSYVGIGTSTPQYKLQVNGSIKSSQWNVTEVMGSFAASGGLVSTSIVSTQNFTTNGGTLEIFACGSGYVTSSPMSADVYITDTSGNNLYLLGTLITAINETSSHRSMVSRCFVKTGVPAGTYMIKFISSNLTYENTDDIFSCTVTEWPF